MTHERYEFSDRHVKRPRGRKSKFFPPKEYLERKYHSQVIDHQSKCIDKVQCGKLNEDYIEIIGIDVGTQHLSFAFGFVQLEKKCILDSYNTNTLKFIDAHSINLYKFGNCHTTKDVMIKCNKSVFQGSPQICERLNACLSEYSKQFNDATFVFVEQQPPREMGTLKDIEQLLYASYPQKTYIISPRSMHKFIGMTHLNYEQRKEYVVRYVDKSDLLTDSGRFNMIHNKRGTRYFHGKDRVHDKCDAMLIAYYAMHQSQIHRQSRRTLYAHT